MNTEKTPKLGSRQREAARKIFSGEPLNSLDRVAVWRLRQRIKHMKTKQQEFICYVESILLVYENRKRGKRV